MDILEYLDLEVLDGFVDVVVLFGDVGFEEEPHDVSVKAAGGVVVPDAVLELAADVGQLLAHLLVDDH